MFWLNNSSVPSLLSSDYIDIDIATATMIGQQQQILSGRSSMTIAEVVLSHQIKQTPNFLSLSAYISLLSAFSLERDSSLFNPNQTILFRSREEDARLNQSDENHWTKPGRCLIGHFALTVSNSAMVIEYRK